ncbi:subclass B3 metallo-beta-lactamase [Massilia sp. W12]|uniref:subclass B3 metallo-beta-lactamase n=1 Tax=Massilia sp. W12 TaxID=3126507 RepID=UPI0030CBEAFA
MKHVLISAFSVSLLFSPAQAHQAGAEAASASPAACHNDSGWNDPAKPFKIFGNTWYVGTCGITSLLITSPQGHILIDGATNKGGPLIEANIKALGFKMQDVRHILISHEHFDHAGGVAHLQRVSGAQVHALPAALPVLQSGKATREDPQFLELDAMAPVANLQPLKHGQIVRSGNLQLQAHAGPGHSPGGGSWTWQSCEDKQCRQMAYVDSLTAISDDTYRFSDNPAYVANFRKTLQMVAGLPCEILLTPHPSASAMWQRLGPQPQQALVDAQACSKLAQGAGARLQARLEKERHQQ